MQRREFLSLSAGSLALAVCYPSLTIARVAPGDGEALESAFRVLTIETDGKVTFTSPYTEMGQGSPTAAAQILADALHTDLERMRIVHPGGTAAERSEAYRELFNGGGSGGSQSMATAWPALQDIGATARTLLIMAAAAAWGVPVMACRSETDRIVSAKGSLTYGQLASRAAQLELPETLLRRPASEYRYVGKGRARADLVEILTGNAAYAIDAQMDGMLYAGLERCPTCGGTPTIQNRDEVLAVDGVVDVFALDTSEKLVIAKPAVVVVGRDTYSVLRGREVLRIDWVPGDDAHRDEEAFWSAMRAELEGGTPNSVESVGEFDSTSLAATTEVSADYRTPYQNQAFMEPMTMVAHRGDDAMKIILSTQYPGDARTRIAELTGLEQARIDVENRIMGGSFGRRFMPDCLTETVLVADKLRQPVKLMWTREDDTRHGQYRNASFTRIEARLDDDGGIRRWYHRTVQTHPRDASRVQALNEGMNDTPYDFKAARFAIHGLEGDVNLGPMRSPPHPLKLFALSSFIDELAARHKRDPIDYHLGLIGEPRDLPVADWLTAHGHKHTTERHVEVAKMVRELSEWDAPLPNGYGRGFSSAFIFGTHIAMVVTVALRDDRIHIERADCAVHCGRVINPDIASQQVEGGMIYGLSSAMGEAITTRQGAVNEGNFNNYPLLRFAQAPIINIRFAESDERPSGLGEPATPPAYAALANAVFAASGKRIREIPLNRHIRFA